MIKCRKPRSEKELTLCVLDLMSKIEVYTRVQDVKNQKQDELEKEFRDVKLQIADVETEMEGLKRQVSEL